MKPTKEPREKRQGWSWWTHFLLWFKNPTIGYDPASGQDKSYVVVAKSLFGKIYIVSAREV